MPLVTFDRPIQQAWGKLDAGPPRLQRLGLRPRPEEVSHQPNPFRPLQIGLRDEQATAAHLSQFGQPPESEGVEPDGGLLVVQARFYQPGHGPSWVAEYINRAAKLYQPAAGQLVVEQKLDSIDRPRVLDAVGHPDDGLDLVGMVEGAWEGHEEEPIRRQRITELTAGRARVTEYQGEVPEPHTHLPKTAERAVSTL